MRPTLRTLFLHGGDILKSPGMQIAKENMQHGSVSVFEHSVCVALVCLWLVHRLHLKVNQRALVRGALLHDYFLYDWLAHARPRAQAARVSARRNGSAQCRPRL